MSIAVLLQRSRCSIGLWPRLDGAGVTVNRRDRASVCGRSEPGFVEYEGRIRTDDLPITSRMLGVDLDGTRQIEPAHVGASSVQTAPDGYRRIDWMIIGMIKAHPTQDRMAHRIRR
jgi:hypothetical protein